LLVPYITFAILIAATISTLDAYLIPTSNHKRIIFENQYLKQKNERIDRSDIYRELNQNSILQVNYFDDGQQTAFRVRFVDFDSLRLKQTTIATNMRWKEDTGMWRLTSVTKRVYTDSGFVETKTSGLDTTLTVLPQDLARSSSDVYQLTYAQARNYIAAIERSGAGGIEIPKVQYFGRLAYPLSILVVTIIGFSVASVRRRGGKGIYIAAGLAISFLYLAFMKIAEPFGYFGVISPALAASIAHITFFVAGISLLVSTKK
jgi:lipopolysaccharide export system permease protein